MSLNIKSQEAHELAAELADLTGESMTKAVTEAIRERLERERRKRDEEKLFAELMEIAEQCAADPRRRPKSRGIPLRRARIAALMIVDTSALLAVFFQEPEAEDFRPGDRRG